MNSARQTEILRQYLNQERGKQIQITSEIDALKIDVKDASRELTRYEQAREVVREVGIKTQQSLQYHISDITSLALEAVFDDPYELIVEFVQRRNKTECDLLFGRNGNLIDPITGSGVGALDVASLALRVVAWSMQTPKSRNTIILDEPFRHLSEDMQERASMMLKELSDRLGIQFIVITHRTTLTEYADKVFTVTKRKRISKVK